MKKFIITLANLLIITSVFAQAPQSFKYQTVVRNSSNQIIPNQAVSLRISILQSSPSGTAVYVETQAATTNILGLVNLEVGNGTLVSGNFSTINWGSNSYFVKIELDPAGGTAYQNMGTSQLLSVPYALHAKTAETISYTETDPVFSASPASGITSGSITNWNTAYGWGNHAGLYRPVSWIPSWLDISSKPTTVSGYGITDAMTTSHPANTITGTNITNWNNAFGWGNHVTAGYAPAVHNHSAADITSGTLPVARGGTGATTFSSGNVLIGNGTGAVTTLSRSGIDTRASFPPDAHTHPAADITSGVLNIARIPTGTTGSTVALGDHTHAQYLTAETDPTWNGAANQTGDIGRTGNVGIGTNNPNARLEISGSGEQSLRIHSSSTPGDVSIDFLRAGTTFYDWRIRNTGGDLRFSWSADDLATVNDVFCMKHSTGRVGIGTNTPTAQLHTTGTVRFAGAGTPGTGKVLTSDAQGNATWEPLRYQVGDFAYGGVVIYVEPCGTKGLVCAIENRVAIEWGTSYTLNARAEGIYGGKINTTIIVSVYAAHSEFFQIAARSGMNYNYGGYGDWYLPAKDELNLIHQNYLTINAVSIANGGEAIHSNELYWSSTEYDNGMAWVQRLTSTGAQFATSKSMIRNIRPIRAF